MGMLKSIGLENYKCFDKLRVDDNDELEIAPLTILCGVNSSGKSSILKSLLMLKQSFEKIYDSNSVIFNGELTLNGTYKDVVTNHKISNHIVLSNSFKIENSNFLSTYEKNIIKDLNRVFGINDTIDIVYVNFSIELKKKTSEKLILDNSINVYTINIVAKLKNSESINSTIVVKNTIDDKYEITLETNKPNSINAIFHDCSCHFSGLVLINLYYNSYSCEKTNLTEALSFIYSTFKIIPLQYKGIKYIAPLRNEPNRIYTLSQERTNVGLYGEYTPQIIYEYRKEPINFVIPPTEDIFKTTRDRKSLLEHLNEWCKYLNIDPIALPDNNERNIETLKMEVGNSNFVDVGFGVSQILPILTTCCLMKWHETLILQQPEIHLHPKMQMNFADFILATAYTGRNLIIETHSDHIINRLLRRIMENPKLKNKVKFYFIDKNSNPTISSIEIDEVRGFVNAPEDFFSQFGNESSKIFNAGISNMPKIKIGDNI